MAAIGGASDDEVVEEVQSHRSCGLGEIAGEVTVGVAGIDFTRWMIVCDGKVGGLVDDDRTEDFRNRGYGLVGRTTRQFPETNELAIAVKGEDEEFFGGKVGQLGREEVVYRCAARDGETLGAVTGGPGSQFEGGLELASLGEAKSVFLAEFHEIETGLGNDPAVFAKELASNIDGAGALASRAKKDGD